MNLISISTKYEETIETIPPSYPTYQPTVIFHAYWTGILNEKHLISIRSCRYHHPSHKIILWVENSPYNEWMDQISIIATVLPFSLQTEKICTIMDGMNLLESSSPSYYSDTVRYLLLYKYGGVWFDLDIFFMRSLDPLFHIYGSQPLVYQWEVYPFPNGALFISLEPYSKDMRHNIEFIIDRGKGWGFCQAMLTYDLPMKFTVLPCSWIDGAWITNPFKFSFEDFFNPTDKIYTIETFFPSAFCYHWHNQWDVPLHDTSPIKQLDRDIQNRMMTQK